MVHPEYQISDELWLQIQPLLPPEKPKKKPARPRVDDRQEMNAIFYLARTGCQWKALPRDIGAPSTVHDPFQFWQKAGVFEQMWKKGLLIFDQTT